MPDPQLVALLQHLVAAVHGHCVKPPLSRHNSAVAAKRLNLHLGERTDALPSQGIVQDLITTTFAMKGTGIAEARKAVKDYLEAHPESVAPL
jgi:hypothetical protein